MKNIRLLFLAGLILMGAMPMSQALSAVGGYGYEGLDAFAPTYFEKLHANKGYPLFACNFSN